ncbi:MAG: SDR family oxidoreductase [Alphaproteobacteria bacterium]|nr:SDR family oxidoreductase [Alphaproteobacteria bacterium]
MRSALVTGAGGELGAVIAARIADDGYRVALLDNDHARAKSEAGKIEGAIALAADIADEKSVDAALAEFLSAFGGAPDVLVNNAGIVRFGGFLEHSVADYRRVVDVNLTGTFIVSQAVARRMVKSHETDRRQRAIINVTSLNAVAASPDAGAYPATKAALANLTEHMALSLGKHGIRVNAVGPGFIDAGMSKPIYADPAARAARSAAVPIGRLGTAQDVAELVAFLASDRAGYINGQHILVDGGVFCSLKLHLPRKAPAARN